MLPAYYKHVRTFENTLVTRFFGLHCVKLAGTAQKKVNNAEVCKEFYFDENDFDPLTILFRIHFRFDLLSWGIYFVLDTPFIGAST